MIILEMFLRSTLFYTGRGPPLAAVGCGIFVRGDEEVMSYS